MEDDLINAAGNDVTPKFFHYLRPLIGADMPDVARLRAGESREDRRTQGDGPERPQAWRSAIAPE